MTEENSLVPQTEDEQELLVNDNMLEGSMRLPTYKDINDAGVQKSVKSVFGDFAYGSASDDMGRRFSDVGQLVQYTNVVFGSIRDKLQATQASTMCTRAASMARFWYLGDTLDKALKEGDFGTNVSNQLAKELNVSVSYIYHIRRVAVKLSAVDCYLLGIRGCDSTHLRKLANIPDDKLRRDILNAFVEQFSDTSDKEAMERARKALNNACAARTSLLEVDGTSDPSSGDAGIRVSEEWDAVMDVLASWQKMLKKPGEEQPIDDLVRVLGDFHMSSSVPNAKERLIELKDEAERTRALVLAVKNNLEDAVRELDSLSAVGIDTVN